MPGKVSRQIIRIDEEKCDGCGLCVPACAEGAIQIIDGLARLVSEPYCDGLGACLGECPRGAITMEERLADEFDAEAVKLNTEHPDQLPAVLPRGCPALNISLGDEKAGSQPEPETESESCRVLANWPVQLALVPPGAPFLHNADILLAADCSAFAYAGFHRELLKDCVLLVACPKLDDFQAHLDKLTAIVTRSDPKSITVIKMEVPCCSGLSHLAQRALKNSGKTVPFSEVTLGIKGNIIN